MRRARPPVGTLAVRFTVLVNVDLKGIAEEYAYNGEAWSYTEATEHIRGDLMEALKAMPYARALSNIEVR